MLRPQDKPLEHMVRLARELGSAPGQPAASRTCAASWAASIFSGDMVKQAVGTMSGGEKARLVLAMMVWQRPNLLLLDEPTNHLDLATREALAVALNEFEGTLMLVSHDRALLRSVCDEFWLVGRGGVAPFDGDLDDYQRYLLDEAKRLREEARPASIAVEGTAQPAATASSGDTPANNRSARQQTARERQARGEQSRPLRRQLAELDQSLAAAAVEKARLEQQLTQPLPAADIAQAGRQLKALDAEIARQEERWLALSDQLDALVG